MTCSLRLTSFVAHLLLLKIMSTNSGHTTEVKPVSSTEFGYHPFSHPANSNLVFVISFKQWWHLLLVSKFWNECNLTYSSAISNNNKKQETKKQNRQLVNYLLERLEIMHHRRTNK
eukprot:TRINITY_DN7448_c0_g3_i2.p1 TRINITY_DN7448_c0_g3~~TRINITY_DN7448_c0_g3_i2.p1  ORF type:complete len:116 (-),score=7.67 TRINITY_DN7448_c0_g3_i2:318-665(-)